MVPGISEAYVMGIRGTGITLSCKFKFPTLLTLTIYAAVIISIRVHTNTFWTYEATDGFEIFF